METIWEFLLVLKSISALPYIANTDSFSIDGSFSSEKIITSRGRWEVTGLLCLTWIEVGVAEMFLYRGLCQVWTVLIELHTCSSLPFSDSDSAVAPIAIRNPVQHSPCLSFQTACQRHGTERATTVHIIT